MIWIILTNTHVDVPTAYFHSVVPMCSAQAWPKSNLIPIPTMLHTSVPFTNID